MRGSLCLIFGLALIGMVGCGQSGPERIGMSGTVTYNGEPIEDGEISFQPVAGTQAPPTSTTITEGKYKLPAKWALVPGTYQVSILSYRPSEKDEILPGSTLDRPPPSGGIEVKDQLLPETVQYKSTIERVTIESGQPPLEQDFDLIDDKAPKTRGHRFPKNNRFEFTGPSATGPYRLTSPSLSSLKHLVHACSHASLDEKNALRHPDCDQIRASNRDC